MNPLITLMKREWWEYRSVFMYIPMLIMIVLLFLGILGFLGIVIFSVTIIDLPSQWQSYFQPNSLTSLFHEIEMIWVTTLWLTLLNYFWNCLYHDRQDNSILFWQSMPVSETQTIIAKLLTGLVLVPLVTWLYLMITEFFLWILIGVALQIMGINTWQIIWQPNTILFIWIHFLVMIFVQTLWLFPILSWLILCSSYAKRAPLLIALIPVVMIISLEYFLWGQSYLYQYIRQCLANAYHVVSPLEHLNVMDCLLGLWVGMVFLIIAGILHGRYTKASLTFD